MKEFYEYIYIISVLSPLFFFNIAVSFRLLDNSGYLLLKKEIIIDSSYVSLKILKEQVQNTNDDTFRRKFKQVLLYRKLHRLFLFLMIITLPVTIWVYFTQF